MKTFKKLTVIFIFLLAWSFYADVISLGAEGEDCIYESCDSTQSLEFVLDTGYSSGDSEPSIVEIAEGELISTPSGSSSGEEGNLQDPEQGLVAEENNTQEVGEISENTEPRVIPFSNSSDLQSTGSNSNSNNSSSESAQSAAVLSVTTESGGGGCTNMSPSGSVTEDRAVLNIPHGACPMQISFSSYSHEGTIVPFEDQILVDNITNTYGPGTYNLGPLRLTCNWQTDLYMGPVQEHLLPGQGHTGIIAFDYVQHQDCDNPPSGSTIKITKVIDEDGNLNTSNDQSSGGAGWEFTSFWWGSVVKTTGANGSTDTMQAALSATTRGIIENQKAGFTLFAASCTGATQNGTLNVNERELEFIKIDAGQTVVCTFYNKPNGTQPPANTCPAPSALGDDDVETIGSSGEKTLQQILDDAGYDLDVVDDQKQYQTWNVGQNQEVVVFARFVDHISAYAHVFGYYTDGSLQTFTPIFKAGNLVADGAETLPEGEDGPFTIHTGQANSIGFAIAYFDGEGQFLGMTATETSNTSAGSDKVLVYNPDVNKYVLGFEDWIDNDFQDLVVHIVMACAPVEGDENLPPIANAGPDRNITLPTNSTTLDGSGSSDPDGVLTSFVWTQVSGPSTVDPADNVVPTVSGLVQGTYVFKLTVTDNDGASRDDSMQVVVNPPVSNPQCSDDVDNADPEDTLIDEADPGCHTDGNPNNSSSYNPNDNDETDMPECSDTVDNADPEDTLADALDPGCHTDGNAGNSSSYDPQDDDETNSGGGGGDEPECSDDVDNTDPEDTLVDEADPGCHTDGNPNNSSSYNPNDDDETNAVTLPECSDGVDNADPEDTLVDSADPGCHTDGDAGNSNSYNPNDNNETNTLPQCSDTVDNADPEDTLADAADPGCHTDNNANNSSTYNPNDDDETDVSSGGGGGGGGGSSSGSRRRRATREPEVLGATTTCGIYVEKYLRLGYVNNVDDVRKVQSFLNTYMNAGLVVDGFYGPLTESAVRRFQVERLGNVLTPWGINESTGIFYLTTQTEVNNIMCPPLELPIPQPLINWSINPYVSLPPPIPN